MRLKVKQLFTALTYILIFEIFRANDLWLKSSRNFSAYLSAFDMTASKIYSAGLNFLPQMFICAFSPFMMLYSSIVDLRVIIQLEEDVLLFCSMGCELFKVGLVSD